MVSSSSSSPAPAASPSQGSVPPWSAPLARVHRELRALTLRWASGASIDEGRAGALRAEAARLNHAHYRAHIPAYRRLCAQAGITTDDVELATLKGELMMPDDVFKSYPQQLLDEADYAGMTRWLGRISDLGPTLDGAFDAEGLTCIDDWIEALEDFGVHLVFSSGTSGHMSFVPRDEAAWAALTETPRLYIPAAVAARGTLGWLKPLALSLLGRHASPATFSALVDRVGLSDFDGFFLNFSGGNQGVQLAGRRVADLTRRAVFLYDTPMSPAAVRAIVRGPRTERERALADGFLATTVRDKEQSYRRLGRELETSVAAGQKVLLFGTPWLVLEQCRRIEKERGQLTLPTGSLVVFGGGWKAFDGSRVPREELVGLIGRVLGVPPAAVMEGYSMTEINALLIRCPEEVYHVPPFLEVDVYDEELRPLEASEDDGTRAGTLGVLDPFATSYPGFLMTGDFVRLSHAPCRCGLSGPTVHEVQRAAGREVKGCGGIMAAVNA